MANVYDSSHRTGKRIQYTIVVAGKKIRRDKHRPTVVEARLLVREVELLEQATRTQIATSDQIENWIDRRFIKPEEAAQAFPGYTETAARLRRTQHVQTDYDRILERYDDYSAATAKGGVDRKTHANNMSVAKKVIAWLKTHFPQIKDFTQRDAEGYREELQASGYAPWTIFHHLTKLRLLFDQALELDMADSNPARLIKLRQPKRTKRRRVLSFEEAKWMLDISTDPAYQWLSGTLSIVVQLGLYAGLRNSEMAWFDWDWIEWDRRVLHIIETECKITGERWVPKDFEMRAIDVKGELIEALRREHQRQEEAGLLNQFVLPAGSPQHPGYRGKPLSQDAIEKAFKKMMGAVLAPLDEAERKKKEGITVYSLRHTYITFLLRRERDGGAGLDPATVMKRAGTATYEPPRSICTRSRSTTIPRIDWVTDHAADLLDTRAARYLLGPRMG